MNQDDVRRVLGHRGVPYPVNHPLQSMVSQLQNVEMLGRPTRVAASENSSVSTPIVVPAMKIRGFNLASVSDAI